MTRGCLDVVNLNTIVKEFLDGNVAVRTHKGQAAQKGSRRSGHMTSAGRIAFEETFRNHSVESSGLLFAMRNRSVRAKQYAAKSSSQMYMRRSAFLSLTPLPLRLIPQPAQRSHTIPQPVALRLNYLRRVITDQGWRQAATCS
jgi:hypothetical protein